MTVNHPFYLKTEQAIINGAGQLTKADIIKLTGAEHDEATEVLLLAVRHYHSRYRVTDEGVMIFDFGKSAKRKAVHHPGIIEETWQLFLKKSEQIISLWIRYVLVWAYGFIFWTLARVIIKKHKNAGYEDKKLSQLILDFTFGPAQTPLDELARHKELAAFAAEHDGVVSAYDVMLLFGCNKEEAEELLYECIIRYNGYARLNENHAVFYAEFSDLLTGKSETSTGTWTEYYKKPDDLPVLSGNPPGIDRLLLFLNIYTLFMIALSALINSDMYMETIKRFANNPILAIMYCLNILAVFFMALGIVLPIYRKLVIHGKRQQIHINEFKKLIFMKLEEHPAHITQNQIEQLIPAKVNSANAQQTAEQLLREFGAEAKVNNNGTMLYDLNQWVNHSKAMQEIRLSKRSNNHGMETTAIEDYPV